MKRKERGERKIARAEMCPVWEQPHPRVPKVPGQHVLPRIPRKACCTLRAPCQGCRGLLGRDLERGSQPRDLQRELFGDALQIKTDEVVLSAGPAELACNHEVIFI